MKTKFRELVLLVTMYIAGALMCWIVLVIQQLNRDLEDPCHFEHIKGLSNDQNASGRFVYCTDRQLQKISYSKDEIRYYFRYLDKNIKFSPDEQKIVDEAKKLLAMISKNDNVDINLFNRDLERNFILSTKEYNQ